MKIFAFREYTNVSYSYLYIFILYSTLEEDSYDSEDNEVDHLVIKFQKLCAKSGSSRICQPKQEQKVVYLIMPCFLF